MGEFIILAVFIILTIAIIPHLLDKYYMHFLQIYIFYMQKI